MRLKKWCHYLFILTSMLFGIESFAQKINTADTIIQKVIALKNENSPRNFEIKAYNRLLITANPDSIAGRVDTIYKNRKRKKILKEIDSSDYNFKKIITKQHLYVAEKVTSYQSINNKVKENIKATRMAGFNEPVFEYFSLQLLPFSVYENRFTIVEKEFYSPISKEGTSKYSFHYLNTQTLEKRLVHVIQFDTKAKVKQNTLSGFLYIDAQKFSIAKMEMNVNGIVNINVVYDFKFNQNINNWFLSKNNLNIKKGDSKSPIRLFGEKIVFEGNKDRLNPDKKKFASDFVDINSTTHFYAPIFNLKNKLPHPDIAIEIDENAIGRKQDYWFTFFSDSTDSRRNSTYISIDSLAEKRRIERKINIGRKVINGFYPIGFFDFDLRYLVRFNNYEGFRLGVGGVTNEKLSKHYKIEAYSVYGTRDGVFKGSLANSFKLHNRSETWLGIAYTSDVKPIASTAFELDKRGFNLYDSRPFNISTYYGHETWKAFLETKLIPKTESLWQITRSYNDPKFNYSFINNGISYKQFNTTLFSCSLEWNPFSKFMQTPHRKIEIEKNYPKFTFQFSKTLNVFENDFNFGKLDFRFNFQKNINQNHKILFLMEAGYNFGDAPITHLYNHAANNFYSDNILGRTTLAAKDKFETMYFNEFFSKQYVFTQFEYQFPRVELARRIKPVFSIVTRFGLGNLRDKDKHAGIEFKTLEKGFVESGIEMNRIYKGIGLVFYYRYGPNSLPRFDENIAINLSFDLGL